MESLILEDFSDYELEGGLPISAYDIEEGVGIQVLSNSATADSVKATDALAELDWIVDCSKQFSCLVTVGNLIVAEITDSALIEPVNAIKDNCFIWTKHGWGWLVDRGAHMIEVSGVLRKCWIAEACTFDDTGFKRYLNEQGQTLLSDVSTSSPIKTVYARSVSAMELLDTVHRDYVYKHNFVKGDVLAVSSVAGSGKTTMLLKLATVHKSKRVLYLAFNKSLVTEISGKIKKGNINNMRAMTFDSLMWHLFMQRNGACGFDPKLIELKPYNIGQYVQWLQDKGFKLKQYYCKNFQRFCLDTEYTDIGQWSMKVLNKKDAVLEKLWLAAKTFQLVSFDTIRKLAFIDKWFKGYIDDKFDIVLCDETQDFDMNMLRMLLDDTTLPKVFVGDPKQSIYGFRGCINAFQHMPANCTLIEFYSTFRIGDPACALIRGRIPNLWMISKAPGGRLTTIGGGFSDWSNGAVWLFRSWRALFQTARITHGIWVYGFDTKLTQIRNLHSKLNSSWSVASDDDEFEDDLPKFLKSITKDELEALISDIERNLVLEAEAKWKMYTVHSYKGMENDYVRMASDITLEDANLYYVAITRGMKQIILDVGEVDTVTTATLVTSGCSGDGRCLKQCLHKQHIKTHYGSVGYCPSSCVHKCVPEKCMFWSQCKQLRPKFMLDKRQCFDCRIGI